MRKKNDHSNEEFTIEETILIERLRSFRVPAMVEEYKRHFLILLEGRLATSEEASQYTPCEEAGFIDEALAIDIINRMAQNAYSEARKLSK